MISISYGDLIAVVCCLGGLAGVIYAAGKLSARVDSLEEWRRTMPESLNAIHNSIRQLEQMFRKGPV